MKLPVIKHVSNFIESHDQDWVIETLEVLDDICNARGITDEDLDVIGELMSNLEGALEVQKLIKSGLSQKEALNAFMKKVTTIGS